MIETPVLNMLNTKYLVINPQQKAIKNNSASGNAWFVGKLKSVSSSNDEMKSLKEVDLSKNAVVNSNEFSNILLHKIDSDSLASIKMVDYSPNEISYRSKCSSNSAAIICEIYYPKGWNCYVDGKKNDLVFRANYVLRGAIIPAGNHTIEWKFEPETYKKSNSIALIGSILLYAFFFGSIGWSLRASKMQLQ
jgi:uncharacterized membrane protein YfhO